MYKKVDNGLDFVAREKEVLDFWKENHIFEKASKKTSAIPSFRFSTVRLRQTDVPTSGIFSPVL